MRLFVLVSAGILLLLSYLGLGLVVGQLREFFDNFAGRSPEYTQADKVGGVVFWPIDLFKMLVIFICLPFAYLYRSWADREG